MSKKPVKKTISDKRKWVKVDKNICQLGECSFLVRMEVSGMKISKVLDTLEEAQTFRDSHNVSKSLDVHEAAIFESRIKKRESKSYTFGDLMAVYKKKVTPTNKGADREISNINLLERLPIASMPLYTIKAEHIKTMFADIKSGQYRKIRENIKDKTIKPATDATVKRYSNTVGAMFTYAVEELNKIDRSPYADLAKKDKPKDGEARKRRLVGDEYERILIYFDDKPEYQVAVVVFVETAMRQGEMLGADWQYLTVFKSKDSDQKNETGEIFLPETKNSSSRTVPLSRNAMVALKKLRGYGNTEGQIFEGITVSSFRHKWEDALEDLNIKNLRKHDLRHEATSRLVENYGLNIAEVVAITGHKRMEMVSEVYYQANVKKLADKISTNVVPEPSESNSYTKIEKLGELLAKGLLTKAEFNREKKKHLSEVK